MNLCELPDSVLLLTHTFGKSSKANHKSLTVRLSRQRFCSSVHRTTMKFLATSLLLLLFFVGTQAIARDPNLFPDHDCQCNFQMHCAPFYECECVKSGANSCQCRQGLISFYQQCNFQSSCCQDTRRRLSGADRAFAGDEPEYLEYLEQCGDYEYEAVLFVDSHLHGVVSPKEEAVEAGCPFLVVHSTFQGDAPARKEILFFEDKESGESLFADGNLKQGSLSMGTFQLHELARAYDKVDPNAIHGSGYDIVTNNCGAFMVNLATHLGLTVDAKVTSFVARRLLEDSGKQLVDTIRSSAQYLKLFGDTDNDRHLLRGESASDQELVEALVESHAAKLYE